MAKRKDDIAKVLNLKSHEGISAGIAHRQLAVITKAYEYLSKRGNNVIYIADEVGLGKTYIGLGIAALLRHYSPDPARHCDLMIVPKKNLQDKWLKELRNFAKNNYVLAPGSFLEATLATNIVHDRLRPISPGRPFSIFRMTSFSALMSQQNRVREYFEQQVFGGDAFCSQVLWKAYYLDYFNKPQRGLLLRLVACLLNAMSEKVDCLIVDEAHNYKYGPGDEEGDGAIRNQVTARFLGALKDNEILEQYPEVKDKMKFPLAKKVICLSATPKDRQLTEIKLQLDCFTRNHPLKKCKTADDIKALLPYLLIRGNMEYHLNGTVYSRNQCRHEHRRGNVIKQPDAEKITMGDDLENVFWQLLQYQSIRHLSQKNNASFEIGMLAGFESYELDMDKRVAAQGDDDGLPASGKEYEILKKKNEKTSEDANVIRSLIGSYKETFGNEPPPHPKLSRLEDELLSQFGRQEKSLIFVRRIATVDELLRHVLQRYDLELVNNGYLKLEGKWRRYLSGPVIAIRKACHRFYNEQKRINVLTALSEAADLQKWWQQTQKSQASQLTDLLRYCYDQEDAAMYALLDVYLATGKFKTRQKKLAFDSLKAMYQDWSNQIELQEPETLTEDEPELRADSFFKDYFKKGRAGFNFKAKIYRENWFDLNYFQLLFADDRWKADAQAARETLPKWLPDLSGRRPHQVFNAYQEAFRNALFSKEQEIVRMPSRKGVSPIRKETFITELLLKHCQEEWAQWKEKHRDLEWPEVLTNFASLNSLLQSVFQHGSGLLPAFVADAAPGSFNRELINLIKETDAPFHFVLKECKIILRDFNLIMAVNFQERDSKKITDTLKNISPVVGASGQDKNRSAIAARFRMPGFPYALIATDIFHEGEDLHTYCQSVYHYGIAWNPSSIEQRTGRIDRINSLSYRKLNGSQELCFENKVQVFYPYLSRSVEVNQVVKLLGHVNQFLQDFNDIDANQQYDSQVQVDLPVRESDIPPAITGNIHSKYDVEHFKG